MVLLATASAIAPHVARAADLVPPRPTAPLDLPSTADVPDTITIDLLLNIDEHGTVTHITAQGGDPTWTTRVADALYAMPFAPATEDGRPIAVEVPFRWVITPLPVRLTARVRVAGTRAPAPDLTLTVAGAPVVTDEHGQFALRGLPDGAVTVHLTAPGFRMDDVTVELAPDEQLDVALWVTPERWTAEVVGVYAQNVSATVRRSLSHDAFKDAPGGLGDPVRALQNVLGLTRTPLDAGWLLVRGGDPEDTPVFLDGVRVPGLFHLGGLTSVLHPEMVERVDLYPGAPPARLSRGTSGAAELTSRRLAGDTRVVGGVNVAFAHLFAEAPLGEHSGVALAARRSYLDGVLAAFLGPERAQIAPRFWDVEARVDTPNAGLTLLGVWDATSFPSEQANTLDDAGQRSMQAQGRLSTRVGGADVSLRPWFVLSGASVAGFRDEQTVDRAPGARLDVSGETHGLRWSVGTEASHHAWSITRSGEHREATSTSVDPYGEISGGGEISGRLALRADTLFVPGHLARVGMSPRGDVQWRVTDALTLHVEAWRAHQEPPRTLLLAYPDGPYLPLERATGVALGTRLDLGRWGADASLWDRALQDVVGLEPDGTLGRFRGAARGVESQLWFDGLHLSAQLIVQAGLTRAAAEPGDALRATAFDQPLRVNAVGTWHAPRDWSVAARARFSSGLPAPLGTVAVFDILQQRQRAIDVSPSGRLPPYYALDVRVSHRFLWRKWQLDAYLDVQNTLNRRIAEPAINGIDETVLVYGYGLPVLPLFGVDATFWPGRPDDG